MFDRMFTRRLTAAAGAVVVAGLSASSPAATLYWNPNPLTNTWDTTSLFWATTSGGAPTVAWTDGSDATFDQAGTYTVTPAAARTDGTLSVAGTANVTLGGSNTVGSTTVSVASGASLTGGGDQLLKSGTTALVANGTLAIGSASGGHLATLSGAGVVTANSASGSSIRLSGTASTFAGTLRDFDTSATGTARGRVGLNGNGAAYNLTLSGDNSQATGDFVVSAGAATKLHLLNANAIGSASYMTLGNAANQGLIELGAGDFTRAYNATSAATGNGGISWSGSNAGFYATGADRNLTFVTTAGGSTAADVAFGTNGLTATGIVLSDAAATNKLTWTNNIDLGTATRTIVVGDGSAANDAELSGTISGTTAGAALGKTGAGRLIISGQNTFVGNVSMTGSGVSVGYIRPTNSLAFGADATVKNVDLTASTGASTGGIELTGGLTFNNKNLRLGGRTVGAAYGALINVSGDNTWNGAVAIGGAGGGYSLLSSAGTLTLGGQVSNEVANSGRVFNLFGAGNYAITGAVKNGTSVTAATTGLTMAGTGTTTLSGANTYTGGTLVSAGTLVAASASGLGAGTVTVGSDGTNAVTGTALRVDGAGPTAVAGLTALTVNTGNTVGFSEVGDQLKLASGVFTLGNVTLDLNNAFNAAGTYTLIDGVDGANAIGTTAFTGVNTAAYNYSFAIVGNDGVLTVSAVPEPAALAVVGLAGVLGLRRRRA